MPTNVKLPNGVTINDVPDGVTKADIADFAIKNGLATLDDFPDDVFETTWPEFLGGAALDLGIGTMRATKAIPDLASFVLPDAITEPASQFFERGIESAEWLKPEQYKREQQRTAIKRDEQGEFAGFQLPSAESVMGITAGSIPQIPLFLIGGPPVTQGLKALKWFKANPAVAEALGWGTVNAAIVAPDQYRQTYQEAVASGMGEQAARDAASASALITAAVSGTTGALGGAVAQKLGAASSTVPRAVAKGFVAEAPFEGVEEAGQSLSEDIGMGRPLSMLNAADRGLMGFIGGGVPGAGIAAFENVTQRQFRPLTQPEIELELVARQAEQEYLQRAATEMPEAAEKASDNLPVIYRPPTPATPNDPVAAAARTAAQIQQQLGQNFPLSEFTATESILQPGYWSVKDASGQQVGPDMSQQEATILSSMLTERAVNRIVENDVDLSISRAESQGAKYTPTQKLNMKLLGRRLFHPRENVFTAEQINKAVGETVATEARTYTVAEAKQLAGDRAINLDNYVPAVIGRKERFKKVKVGDRYGIRSNLSKETVFTGFSPDTNERFSFPDAESAQAYAQSLNNRIRTGQRVYRAEITNTGLDIASKSRLEELLREKNITSKIDSPEMAPIVRAATGAQSVNSLNPADMQLLYHRLRAIPRFDKPTKLPDFAPRDYTPEQYRLASRMAQNTASKLPEGHKATEGIPTRPELENALGKLSDAAYEQLQVDLKADRRWRQAAVSDQMSERERLAVNKRVEDARKKEQDAVLDAVRQNLDSMRLGQVRSTMVGYLRHAMRGPKGETVLGEEVGDKTSYGGYRRSMNEIFIALEAQKAKPEYQRVIDAPEDVRIDTLVRLSLDTLNHESVHAFRQADLFMKGEWELLTKLSREQRNKDGESYLERAQRDYRDLDGNGQQEEAVAELIRDGLNGTLPLTGRPRTIFQKIMDFIRGIAGLKERGGYGDFESLLTGITSGEIGARPTVDESGKPVVRTTRALERGFGPDMQDQKAYHGSGSTWNTPDLSKVGTGQGSIAYGWGFYAADAKGVADVHGTNMYEVDIPDNAIGQLLQWDKSMEEQPRPVRNALKVAAERNQDIDKALALNSTGKELYEFLAKRDAEEFDLNRAKAASQYLNSIGIPGIRYLDSVSRSASKAAARSTQGLLRPLMDAARGTQERAPTYNYVVFDEKYIKPLTRNGQPIDMAEQRGEVDTSLGERREAKELGEFTTRLNVQVTELANERIRAIQQAESEGIFDGYPVGARLQGDHGVLTIEGYDLRPYNKPHEIKWIDRVLGGMDATPTVIKHNGKSYIPMLRTSSTDGSRSNSYLDAVKALKVPLFKGPRAADMAEQRPTRPRVGTTGQYIGFPKDVDSPQKVAALLGKVNSLAEEGEYGKFWFERSANRILEITNYDYDEAEKLTKAIAITSTGTRPELNFRFAVQAYLQSKDRGNVRTGRRPNMVSPKLQAVLDGKPWTGANQKTKNFYNNLMAEIDPKRMIDPESMHGVTIDIWMMRAFGHIAEKPTTQQYKQLSEEITHIADQLTQRTNTEWTPHQVQAAIWVALKSRMENPGVKKKTNATSLKKGWAKYVKDRNGKKALKVINKQQHNKLWLQNAMRHSPTKADRARAKFDYADAIEGAKGQASVESVPGKTTNHFPEARNATPQQLAEFHVAMSKAILSEKNVDLVSKGLKMLSPGKFEAPGFWEGKSSPSTQREMVLPHQFKGEPYGKISESAAALMDAYSAIVGVLFRQDAVGWHRPFYHKKEAKMTLESANGVEVDIGRPFTAEETLQIAALTGYDPIASPTGVRLINYSKKNNKAFQKEVNAGLTKLQLDGINKVTATYFASDNNLVEHNWNGTSDGKGYLQTGRLAGRPDLQRKARRIISQLEPRIRAVEEEFADRYGWTRGDDLVYSRATVPGPAESAVRPSRRSPEKTKGLILSGKAAPGAQTFVGVHYGQTKTDTLEGSRFGTGIRGAEQARLAQATDERILKRAYFYIKRDLEGLRYNDPYMADKLEQAGVPGPEAGLGGHVHVQKFNNILNIDSPIANRFAHMEPNAFESAVVDAGYDGYADPSAGVMVILNHDVPVKYMGTSYELAQEGVPANRNRQAAADLLQQRAAPNTPEFKRWFKDSKVVNRRGDPLMVYHGTMNDFSVFDPKQSEDQTFAGALLRIKGVDANYFTDSPDVANTFAKNLSSGVGGRIMPVYLSIQNPLRIDAGGKAWNNYLPKIEEAAKSGHDGVILKDVKDSMGRDALKRSTVYVAFDSNQIKSATGNQGTFSLASDDILQQRSAALQNDPDYTTQNGKVVYTKNRLNNLMSEYGYANGRVIAAVVTVNPQEFVTATSPEGTFRRIKEEAGPLDVDRLRLNSQTPFLQIKQGPDGWYIDSHEGRHRMQALADAGFTTAPVVVYNKFDVPHDNPTMGLKANGKLGRQEYGWGKDKYGSLTDLNYSNPIDISYDNRAALNETYATAGQDDLAFQRPQGKKSPAEIFWDKELDAAGIEDKQIRDIIKGVPPKKLSRAHLVEWAAALKLARERYEKGQKSDIWVKYKKFGLTESDIVKAVNALRRHNNTLYDKLLEKGVSRETARRMIEEFMTQRAVHNPQGYVAPRTTIRNAEPKQLGGVMRSWWDRNFRAKGNLPNEAFAVKVMTDAEKRTENIHVEHLLRDFHAATKKAYKKPYQSLPAATQHAMNDFLADVSNNTHGLPNEVAETLRVMRAYLDRLSARIVADGIVEGDAAETVTENIGHYLHRSYQAFDDKAWFDKVPPQVISDAYNFLMQQAQDTGKIKGQPIPTDPAQLRDAINGLLNNIMTAGKAVDNMGAFLGSEKLGRQDRSIFMKRDDIAPEIRALLGEYKDPVVNFTKSANKMAYAIANHRLVKKIVEHGLTDGWLHKMPTNEYSVMIASDGSHSYGDLAGLYTSLEIKNAFASILDTTVMQDWLRTLLMLNGLVKYGKTVLSVTTMARNFTSAAMFSMANGHLMSPDILRNIALASSTLQAELLGVDKTLSQAQQQRVLRQKSRDYYKKLTRLGVTLDNPYPGEMMAAMQDAMRSLNSIGTAPAKIEGTIRQKARHIFSFFTKMYQYGDDFWKIIGFESEKDALIRSGMPQMEAEVEAAKRIRDTYPTYSLIGKSVKWLRRFPLMGTFVSFPAEIVRTSVNILRTIEADRRAGRNELVARRAVGAAVAAGWASAMSAISMAIVGIDDEEDEQIRKTSAAWMRNSDLFYIGYDEDGNLRHIDLSFSDPYNYVKRPFNALMMGGDWKENLFGGTNPLSGVRQGSALRDILDPFLGPDIAFTALSEIFTNSRLDGTGKVYNPESSAEKQLTDIFHHIRKAIQPGTALNIERIFKAIGNDQSRSGQQYNLQDEMFALAGLRFITRNPASSLRYKAMEIKTGLNYAANLLSYPLGGQNKTDEGDVRDAFFEMMQARERRFLELMDLIDMFEGTGMRRSEMARILNAAKISKEEIGAVMAGRVPRWRPSPQFLQNARETAYLTAPPSRRDEVRMQFRDRIKTIHQLVREYYAQK